MAHGVGSILGEWTTYALMVSALVGGVRQQASLKTGVLASALAAINVANLLASIAIGLTVFQERLAHGNGSLVISSAAIAATVYGVITLVSDPQTSGDSSTA